MTKLQDTIYGSIVAKNRRANVPAQIFGAVEWPMIVEPTIYQFAERLCPEYSDGYWQMHLLSNGGFFMYPDLESPIDVISPNGWSGEMSEVGLSFGSGQIAQICGDQYYMNRDFILQQPGYQFVWACID